MVLALCSTVVQIYLFLIVPCWLRFADGILKHAENSENRPVGIFQTPLQAYQNLT